MDPSAPTTATPARPPATLQAEIDRLRREFFAEFGGEFGPAGRAFLHTFAAKERRDGEQWQTGKMWFERKGGKTRRIKDPHASAPTPAVPPKPVKPEKPEKHPKPEKPVQQVPPPNSAPPPETKADPYAHEIHAYKQAVDSHQKAKDEHQKAQGDVRALRSALTEAEATWRAKRDATTDPRDPEAQGAFQVVKFYTGELAKAEAAEHKAAVTATDAHGAELDARQRITSRGGKVPGAAAAPPPSPTPATAIPPTPATSALPKPTGPGTRDEIRGPLGQRVTVPAGPVPADAPPSDPARRAQAANRGWNGRGHPPPPLPAKLPVNGKATSPATPAAAPPPPPPPPPTPAETAHYDAMQASDEKRFGAKPAGILRRAVEALRGFLTLGGLVGGAGLGASIGTAVGGPLGMALGTAVGGGLGGVLGSWTPSLASAADKRLAGWDDPGKVAFERDPATGKITKPAAAAAGGAQPNKVFTPGARTRARVRKVMRKVVPTAAGVAAAGPGTALGLALPAAGAVLGSTLGPAGAAAGAAAGIGGSIASTPGWLDMGHDVSKGVRGAMATSEVSKRKARRLNSQTLMAEGALPAPEEPAPEAGQVEDAGHPHAGVLAHERRGDVRRGGRAAGHGGVPEVPRRRQGRLRERGAGLGRREEAWRHDGAGPPRDKANGAGRSQVRGRGQLAA
jgi:hypothetical protein